MKTAMNLSIHNAALAAQLGVKVGDVVSVPCRKGVPLSREWRNRLRDAKIDDCVRIAQTAKTERKKSTET